MFGLLAPAPVAARDFADCSGCSLCLLVCPMWRRQRDPRFSPEGLAKGLQCGATAADLAAPLDACALCGACDPVCPEGIDLSGLVMELRRKLPPATPRPAALDNLHARLRQDTAPTAVASRAVPLLLPGPELRADAALLARVQALLGLTLFDDDGDDISLALELGVEIPSARLQTFLDALRGHSVVAADGLLLRQLRRWLPGSQRMGLGAALSTRAAVRSNLGAGDLYVIEPRAFHGDYQRLVGFYDRLQRETGCSLSLDLQRIAIPARAPGLSRLLGKMAIESVGAAIPIVRPELVEGPSQGGECGSTGSPRTGSSQHFQSRRARAESGDDDAQAQWIMQGRTPQRIVVESLADRAAFARVCDLPVVHLAELGEDPTMIKERPHAFG